MSGPVARSAGQGSLVHFACLTGDQALVDACLNQFGFDLVSEQQDSTVGLGTPVHCAVAGGHVELVQHLFQQPAPPSANRLVSSFGMESMMALAIASEAPLAQKCEMIATLVTTGASLDRCLGVPPGAEISSWKDKHTTLDRALYTGNVELARWLVGQYRAHAFAPLVPTLHLVARRRAVGLLSFVVQEAGVPINSMENGWSILMTIVMNDVVVGPWRRGFDVEVLREALGLGADSSLRNASGQTPLEKARELGNTAMAAALGEGEGGDERQGPG